MFLSVFIKNEIIFSIKACLITYYQEILGLQLILVILITSRKSVCKYMLDRSIHIHVFLLIAGFFTIFTSLWKLVPNTFRTLDYSILYFLL